MISDKTNDLRSVTANHRSMEKASNVACDACILINFLNIRKIEILGKLSQYRFQILDAADAEVLKSAQRRDLDVAYRQRVVYRADPPCMKEIVVFADLTRSMGRGEAACLAAAQCRKWMVASDEGGKFKKTAIERIGCQRIIGTADILLAAIRNESITLSQADEVKAELERHAFKMPFASFSDRLNG